MCKHFAGIDEVENLGTERMQEVFEGLASPENKRTGVTDWTPASAKRLKTSIYDNAGLA